MNIVLPTPYVSGGSDMTRAAMPSNCLQDVGDRFSPSEFELIDHYLYNKMVGNDELVMRIPTQDVYDYDPWELPRHSKAGSNDTEYYFFCPRYINGGRVKRKTKGGKWNSSGRHTKIKNEQNGEVIGMKNHLYFVTRGTPRGKSSGWKMYEFSATHNPNEMSFVVIKLMKKPDPTRDEGEASRLVNYDHENQNPDEVIDLSPVTSGEGSHLMGIHFGCNAAPSEEGVVSSDMSLDSVGQTPFPTSDDYSTTYEGGSRRQVTSVNFVSNVMFPDMVSAEYHKNQNPDEVIDLSPVTSGERSHLTGFHFGCNTAPSEEGVVSSDMSLDSVGQTPYPTSDYSTSYEGGSNGLVTSVNFVSDVMFPDMVRAEYHENQNSDEVIDLSPVTSGEGSHLMGIHFGCNAAPSEEGVVSSDMSLDSVGQTPYPTSDYSTSYEGGSSRLVTSANFVSDVMFPDLVRAEYHENQNSDEVIDLSPVTSGEGSHLMGIHFGCNAASSEEGVVSSDMSLDSVGQTPYTTSDYSTSYEGGSSRLVTSVNFVSDVMFPDMADREAPLPSLEWFHGYDVCDYSLNRVFDTIMPMDQEADSDSGFYTDLDTALDLDWLN